MASRQITQETFDTVVQENITEFEMEPDEAVNEAVQQFESQGVDLSNIIKALPKPAGSDENDRTHEILQTLDSLRKSVDLSALSEMGDHLLHFSEQCKQGMAYRFLAAQKFAYPVVLSAWKLALGDQDLMMKALYAMSSLTDGQPDLLEPVGQQLLVKTLGENVSHAEVTLVGIRIIRHVCLKHEQNRQDLVKSGILPLLTGAMVKHGSDAEVVREACSALKIMTFDDDIRVPFGHAHEHAKMIVMENNGLKVIIETAKGFMNSSSVLSELCSTLARLSVRNEFCQEIVDLGGLNFMVALLADCIDHQEVVKQVLSAVRAIAGNDDVKDAIVNTGGTDLIVLAMNQHISNPQICEQGCAALCMLALRKPENCKVIMEGGGALAALQAMKAHPKEVTVQKQACMLIRNLVSRMRDFSQPILEMGAETLILEAQAAHRDCDDVAKAALRDLGCKVEFRELWTGQKGSLAQ
ncbi:armadillo repeat-containing protein 6 [Rhinatrema bivittatum]|uniref:armadillo repeat-containing protein 6 n=1 Tax=Rhinatrema bivittatum TaxID=194408 RepID=UPI00112CFAF9|nr:armadillo repeat-containing protein 6 [Rhinatrema bivittatum]XP_029469717.1 armadillo repeat-containing protein 6 [Rhinatrema bivittatum]XP_029469718.1 armadillo repeat-containing protein 6 [Rhinatrema bivittatum]XP_029469719.1 armadillo repeat-containing protein 6 [Rhinatrema bivittatum]XP_029469720.1 armadillo repeat-containing protein 6 [Rhinatrema bivittatum]